MTHFRLSIIKTCCGNIHETEQVGIAVILYNGIWELPNSNISKTTSYPEISLDFSWPSRQQSRESLSVCYSKLLWFITYTLLSSLKLIQHYTTDAVEADSLNNLKIIHIQVGKSITETTFFVTTFSFKEHSDVDIPKHIRTLSLDTEMHTQTNNETYILKLKVQSECTWLGNHLELDTTDSSRVTLRKEW
jgi:hypothetical protein